MSLSKEQIINNLDEIFEACMKWAESQGINISTEVFTREKLEEFSSDPNIGVPQMLLGYTFAVNGVDEFISTDQEFMNDVYDSWVDHAVEKFNREDISNDI